MSDDRLRSKLVVAACLRWCSAQGLPAFVLRHGDDDAGVVFVKVNRLEQGCSIYSQIRDADGRLVWLSVFGANLVAEAKADAYLARQKEIDRDLWIVELETRQGLLPPMIDRILEE